MKFSAQEEYGLRCALQVARRGGEIITIPEIAEAEGLTVPYVAKLMRLLLKGGLVASTRGHQGGYRLSRPATEINIADVMVALGAGLFPEGFCTDHSGARRACVHSTDCAIRPVFSLLDSVLTDALVRISLTDLLAPETRVLQLLPIRLDRARFDRARLIRAGLPS